MRKIITLFAVFFALTMFCGCSDETADAWDKCINEISVSFDENFGEYSEISWSMETVEQYGSYRILREPLTDVLYIEFNGIYKGGLTVMINPYTNSALTYSDYMSLHK